jgi:hypothetical protein
MEFIERLLGFSPDGGSGMTELSLFVVLILLGGLIIRSRRKART